MNRSYPLHLAAIYDAEQLSQLLVSRPEDVNDVDSEGRTPLHIAIECCREESVSLLLNKGANVNVRGRYGRTPLHNAVFGKKLECVSLLLSKGADVNVSDSEGKTPLHYASGSENNVSLLLSKGAVVNVSDSKGQTPLHYALDSCDEKIVSLLLSKGADVNVSDGEGKTPLQYAVYRRSLECVSLLLSKGADVNVSDGEGKTPLHYASKSGSENNVSLLLSKGANVNVSDSEGMTPLHYAVCEVRSKNLVEILLLKSANVNARNIDGITALHVACFCREAPVVKELLDRGAGVELKCFRGYTALHIAADSERSEAIIVLLLDHGADIDSLSEPVADSAQPASSGAMPGGAQQLARQSGAQQTEAFAKTPLYVAVERGLEGNVRLLLAHGADINIRCGDCTPLMCAERKLAVNRRGYRSWIPPQLERHMVLLKTANFFVNERDLEAIVLCSKTELKCKNELAKLQKCRIGTSNVTFYDFLSKEQSECAALYKKENVGEILSCGGCTDVLSFENYGMMIKYRLVIARERPAVSSKAILVLADVLPMLPFLCLEKIADFIGYSDLKKLCGTGMYCP